jgi:preprotein translocase subunit SecA
MKKLRPLVRSIDDLESQIRCLTDDELRGKTAQFREKLDQGATLDDLVTEAFAVVREASMRSVGMRHYDVQLVGGLVLHQGKIAEMKTGEGKTLVATLPLYLNALAGRGAHLVTVNDYLAKRDAEWMGQIYSFLGLSTGIIEHGQGRADKKKAYNCDITYGQNNEFGFDYLRDNMRFSIYDYVQRDLHYAIVDEADSILIDEARTPLIISGAAEESAALYSTINQIIPKLGRDIHFNVDEERRSVTLTEEGVDRVEKLLSLRNLYDPDNIEYLHHVNQALKAHYCYKKDVNYAVKDGNIVIIDEFTGRLMPGRRWSDGLHQAVEAKENVRIQEENRTMATISFQNLFRLYDKLGGMTGTADTEAAEFEKTYKLDVVVIPTNRPCIRADNEDQIYRSYREKRTAVIDEILDCRERGQPVLVGTVSVEKSEDLSRVLTKKKIAHSVLNAKHHQSEAYIVAQAGRTGSVTVATNMAGRGTDILLGGNPVLLAQAEYEELRKQDESKEPELEPIVEKFHKQCAEERERVLDAGGLHILGTERHESRRIDNQLRGRAGRQGDPGSSRFFLSLEDDLMRIFAGDRVAQIMDRLGMPEGEPIEHRMVTRSVERAQTKVEARNFDIRKNLLEYDDVMNQQRKTIYAMRRQILEGRYEAVAISDNEEVRRQVANAAHHIEVDPVLQERAGASLRRWFLALGRTQQTASTDTSSTDSSDQKAPRLEDLATINAEALERTVYEQFGVRVPLAGYENRPQEAYELAWPKVSQGLSEQRERLYDMADTVIERLVGEHASERDGSAQELDSLVEAMRKVFDAWVEDLSRFSSSEELVDYLFKEVEWIIQQRDAETSLSRVDEVIADAVYHVAHKGGQEPAEWDPALLAKQLDSVLPAAEWGDLGKLLTPVGESVSKASTDDESGTSRVGVARRELSQALRDHYLEIRRNKNLYLQARDEEADGPHPAEKLVRELVQQHCPKGQPSHEWPLDKLGQEFEDQTGAPPIRFTLDVLQRDAARFLERTTIAAAQGREKEVIEKIVNQFCPGRSSDKWNREGLADEVMNHRGIHSTSIEMAESRQELKDGIWRDIREQHERQVIAPLLDRLARLCPEEAPVEEWKPEVFAQELDEQKIVIKDADKLDLRTFVGLRLLQSAERVIRARAHVLNPEAHLHAYRQLVLSEIDRQWIDHLQNMEALRQGIGLTSYGQRDPKREYQREGYGMFQALVSDVQYNTIEKLFHLVFRSEEDAARLGRRKARRTVEGRGGDQTVKKGTVRRDAPKVGRNDPCPCGSGKKYKKCCMVKEQLSA